MAWRLSPEEFRGLRGHDLATLGIPGEQAYLDAYCRRSGRGSVADWNYYIVLNMFRLAAILQGILARALKGNAASVEGVRTGRQARAIAGAAWRQVQAHERGGAQSAGAAF